MPSTIDHLISGMSHTYPPAVAFDDYSRQVSAWQIAWRTARGLSSQRAGTAMRIAKPSSANNSPRSSLSSGRRRTLLDGGSLARRRQQVMDHVYLPPPGAEFTDPTNRAARPVSWHPTSGLQELPQEQEPPQQLPQYPSTPSTSFDALDDQDLFHQYQMLSPIRSTYSCNTSPCSTFSPLSLPLTGLSTQSCLPGDGWAVSQQIAPSYASSASLDNNSHTEAFPCLPLCITDGEPTTNTTAWESFVVHGFTGTSPPTPESIPQAQQAHPTVPCDEAIPFQSLEEQEEDGEILVGMGLYDTPEKNESEVTLANFHTTISAFLGATCKPYHPTGKGLMLEETWEPPEESEDEAEDDDDEEEDADNPSATATSSL